MRLRTTCAFIAIPATAFAWLMACSGTTPEGSQFDPSSPNPGNDAGTQDVSSGGGDGGDQQPDAAEDTGSIPLIDSGLTGDGSLTKDAACAIEHVVAEEIPIDLFIMADRSSSMDGSGWTSQSAGLNAFFTDPLSQGIWIALSFFPFDGSCDSQIPSCNGDLYYKPQVQWGELPGHATVLENAIATTEPDGCTPTQDALNGVLRGAFDRQTAFKDHVVAAVIVSDGEPCCGMCPIENASGLGQIATQYANGSPPIKTFAIYAASSASDSMHAIALGGGTQQAYNATGGTSAFIAALDEIRTALIACEYKVPTPEAGTINTEAIEVEFTAGDGTVVKIPRIKPPEECNGNPGWHYDDDANPTRIILCPASCEAVQGDEDGQVDILVGCDDGQT